MHTTVLLVRHGETEWTKARRVIGRRDLALSETGRAQAEATARRLAGLELAEILSSPLLRAVETAEAIAATHTIEVARDPRLNDVHVGPWEGKPFAEVARLREYQAFLRDPSVAAIPDGESLEAVRDRAAASVTQALEDNDAGSNIVIVTHAGVARVLLAHYLAMRLGDYHRLRVSPGSISVLRFDDDRELPRVLALNHGDPLDTILA